MSKENNGSTKVITDFAMIAAIGADMCDVNSENEQEVKNEIRDLNEMFKDFMNGSQLG